MTGRDRPAAVSDQPPDERGEARMRTPSSVAGAGVALTLFALGLAACGSVQKAELDREVDRLCAIDGGVHVYEVVRLPKEDFGPDGTVFPQYRHLPSNKGRFSASYFARVADKVLVTGDPAMGRINTQIVRASDDKVLGELVIYRRSGGGGSGLSERSEYSCPKGPVFNLETQVFKPQEK